MKKIAFLLTSLVLGVTSTMAQGAYNIKINEVMTNNTASIVDEFGNHDSWVELVNTAYSSYNVRGMYITTNRAVLDPDMKAADRMKLMSIIPNGETRTALSARQHVVFYLSSNPAEGSLHLQQQLDSTSVWVALYDGNAVDLIDSVSLPVIPQNCSYARKTDGGDEWQLKAADAVTPGIQNFIQVSETKVDMLKRDDPHGFGITVLSMGIVFSCLALLWLFFSIIGWAFSRTKKITPVVKTVKKADEVRHKTSVILKDGVQSKGIDKEVYIAVISMALKQYLDDVHDVESGVITIKPRKTSWSNVGQATEIPTLKKN